MKQIQIVAIGILLVIGYSCNHVPGLSYSFSKAEYNEVAKCLLTNYNSVFQEAGTKSTVVVYYSGFKENKFCQKAIFELLQKQAVNTITFSRDSVISFSSKSKGTIKSIQSILVYSNNKEKLIKKLTSVVKLKSVLGNGWYELEEIDSIAN